MPASFSALIDLIARGPAGRRIGLASGLCESQALIAALQAAPDACADAVFAGLFIPGVNRFDYSSLHPAARMETPLLSPALRAGFEAGRVHPYPFSYFSAARLLAAPGASDVGVAVVTPGPEDYFSFGVSPDTGPAILAGANSCVALVNASAPRLNDPNRTVLVPRSRFCGVIETDEPLNWAAPEPAPTGALAQVAARVAALVNDGDCLQLGIGKLPGAILNHLRDRQRLRIWSGLYAEGVVALLEAGAVDQMPHAMMAGVALCSEAAARAIVSDPRARFAPVELTHAAPAIAGQQAFTAINGAVQVDLFGQVNAHYVSGKLFSGPGGLPDFAIAANAAPQGRAIIALPAMAGPASRIVASLDSPAVTLGPGVAHIIVTEHGVADLRGKPLDGVAQAIIAIANPAVQDALGQDWARIRRSL